jgi:hypothetical protein
MSIEALLSGDQHAETAHDRAWKASVKRNEILDFSHIGNRHTGIRNGLGVRQLLLWVGPARAPFQTGQP